MNDLFLKDSLQKKKAVPAHIFEIFKYQFCETIN